MMQANQDTQASQAVRQAYLERFLTDCAYPPNAVLALCAAQQAMADTPSTSEVLTRWLKMYENGESMDYTVAHKELEEGCLACGVNAYTGLLVFYCLLTQPLWERYQAAGYPRVVFDNTVLDLRYKAVECKGVHGVWGTFTAPWFAGFFDCTRFALGRLQYEIAPLPEPCTLNGVAYEKGTPAINIHIPEAGPLSPALCEASLAQARAFFAPKHPLFMCESWLLFPPNEQILSEQKNILHFMRRFQIIQTISVGLEVDMWRIFRKTPAPPFEDLPCETSLQRAYAGWLRAGNAPGMGLGVFAR